MVITKPGQVRERVVLGQWWFPSTPDEKGGGRLSIGGIHHFELEILGDLGRSYGAEREPIIYGESQDGTSYTLEGVDLKGHTGAPWKVSGRVGFGASTFRALRIYRGGHFNEPHKIRVKKVRFELDFLADWLKIHPIKLDPAPYEEADEWTWRYEKPPPIIANLGLGNVLEIHHIATAGAGEGISVEIPISVKFVVSWPESVVLREAESFIHAIRFFFGFAMSRETAIRNAEYILENGTPIAELTAEGSVGIDEWLSIRATPGFPYAEANERLGEILQVWLRLWRDARGLVDLIAADVYAQTGLASSQFLTLATALEAYHHLDVERNPRKGPKGGDWELKQRLEDLWARVATAIGPHVPDPADKLQRIADVRNYFSHYMRKAGGAKKRPRSHEELQHLIRVARVLLHALIMQDLGLPPTRLRETAEYWMDFETYTLPGIEV